MCVYKHVSQHCVIIRTLLLREEIAYTNAEIVSDVMRVWIADPQQSSVEKLNLVTWDNSELCQR